MDSGGLERNGQVSELICDMHVHTKYSCDSGSEMDDLCAEALRKGVHTVCFTDHIDCNCHDSGYEFYNPERFFADFTEAKEKYKGRLTLLCGIEFAEVHLYPDKLARYTPMPYD
jgi:histidinol-phosphatase (PHP family)